MKRFIYISLLTIILFVSGQARELEGYNKFTDYREIGDTRLWTFVAFDSVIGSLTSTVTSTREIDGQNSYLIKQLLSLDYNKVGNQMVMGFDNNHFVSEDGYYMGDEMKVTFNGRTDEMVIFRKGEFIEGYQTSGDNKIEQKVKLNNNARSIEYNFFDEFENWLASKDLAVGTIFNDTMFMPQSLSISYIEAKVIDFREVQLYRGVYDSCFEISFNQPLQMSHFFNTKKQLKKIVIPSQNMKVYQDRVANPKKLEEAKQLLQQKKKEMRPDAPIGTIVLSWFVYLLFTCLALLFFLKNSFTYYNGYSAFVAGGLLFGLVPFTQIKFQIYFFNEVFIPNVINGDSSALVYGLIPALTTGFIQTVLIVGALFIVYHLLALKSKHLVALGALAGAGFGFIEAAYLANGMFAAQLFGSSLIERGFTIILLTSAGALMGYGLKKNYKLFGVTALCALFVIALVKYMPVFIQTMGVPANMLIIVLAFISILFLLAVVIILRKEERL